MKGPFFEEPYACTPSRHPPGDHVVAPPRTSQGDAHAVFVGDTLEEVDALCDRLQRTLVFRVATG